MAATAHTAAAPVLAAEAEAIVEDAERRGPFRPDRLAPVRERLSGPTLARLFRLVDAGAVIMVAVVVASFSSELTPLQQPFGRVLPLLIGPMVGLWALASLGAYRFGQRESLVRHLTRMAGAAAVGGVAAFVVAMGDRDSGFVALYWTLLTLATLAVVHLWAWTTVRRWRREGRLTPNVIVVGATPNAARLIDTALESREVNVLGIFDDRLERAPSDLHGVPVLGDT